MRNIYIYIFESFSIKWIRKTSESALSSLFVECSYTENDFVGVWHVEFQWFWLAATDDGRFSSGFQIEFRFSR